jgi:hypothetical protein
VRALGRRSGDREAQCRNKITFASRADARQWAREQPRMKNSTPYECGVCGGWHLSSMSKREARRLGYPR